MSHPPTLEFEYGETTRRAYERLPEFYRREDARHGYALLRYMALTFDQASEVEALLDRIEDIATPNAIEPEWRYWLAQLTGTRVTPEMVEGEWRDTLTYASAGWRAGTRKAVEDAARTVLTGERYVRAYSHATTRADAGTASEWDVLIVTRPDETPSPGEVLEAIVRKRAKPAGVLLHHESYSMTWAHAETAYPTWGDWNDVQWRDFEETV